MNKKKKDKINQKTKNLNKKVQIKNVRLRDPDALVHFMGRHSARLALCSLQHGQTLRDFGQRLRRVLVEHANSARSDHAGKRLG
jgi:hypothetical protein